MLALRNGAGDHTIQPNRIGKTLLMKNIYFFLIIICLCNSGSQARQEKAIISSIGLKLLQIEPGTFRMGDLNGQGQWDEHPTRKVTLTKPFYFSETEITIEQFQQFRPNYLGIEAHTPYATGISWYEAVAFCEWLSEKEGKQYRLPTEAEWEYVCRAGTLTPYASGESPPERETKNPWGVKNMHTGVLEWCLDWHEPYPGENQIDPVGPANGFTRIVRGGLLDGTGRTFDHPIQYYTRSANRGGIAPGLSNFQQPDVENQSQLTSEKDVRIIPGLIGINCHDPRLQYPNAILHMENLCSDENRWDHDSRDWSAYWMGIIEAPYTGNVIFFAEANNGIKLEINDTTIIDGWDSDGARSGSIAMVKGEKYPITLSYCQDGGASYMRIYWSWKGKEKEIVSSTYLWHDSLIEAKAKFIYETTTENLKPPHAIGFRVVRASMPQTQPHKTFVPFVMQGVKQQSQNVKQGPPSRKPYFRKRYLLPIPPDNSAQEEIAAAGLGPWFGGHNHCPALEVLPNGDVLLVIYTSYYEYEPEVSLIASRLRFGADEWDMPSTFMDFQDVNDHAPLLWTDDDTLCIFWGNPRLQGAFPFQWATSFDNGATWGDIHFPHFETPVLGYTAQPINSVFKDSMNNIYVASDGLGPQSVLWMSRNNGKTWIDTGGRSGGRHTTYVLLKNGDILGMGGKSSDINGFMPKSVSRDNGKTWEITQTIFPSLGANQRPTLIRLASGRLFFASDFQRIDGFQPDGISERGSYVALSDDEGETWHIKKLPGTLEHKTKRRRNSMKGETLGYSVARQAPNEIIHLVTTMNDPCLHFAMNESWILSEKKSNVTDTQLMESAATKINNVREYTEKYSNGNTRLQYSGGTADDGRFLIHGIEKWFYENGNVQKEATYRFGNKIGREAFWTEDGKKKWEWIFQENGRTTWRQWWPDGNKKSQSTWQQRKCHGLAECWDDKGKLIHKVEFNNGKIKKYINQ